MPKGKPPRNSFYYFMMDFKSKQPRQFENMQAVAMAAGPHWEKMNADERRPYEEKARKQKNEQKVIKYTTTGQNIEVVQKQANERITKEQKMREDIESTVKVAVTTGRIADEVFYIIHVNHFCYCNQDKRYYPAEIAIARFSLAQGVMPDNVYHMIVKPGMLPLGYLAEARDHAKNSHQIEPPLSGEEENNLTQVMQSLMKFMNAANPSGQNYPPFYADAKNRPIAENVLLHLLLEFGYPDHQFKVHSLEYLFYVIRNNVSPNQQVWPVISMSILELEKDIYDYCRDIACSQHELSDALVHCSKSHVIRSAYIICDNCCGDLDIELRPGVHVPRQANVAVSRPQSRASSFASSRASAPKNSFRHHWRVEEEESDYLSQRGSEVSAMSETSTVVDPHDLDALGAYDSEFNQTDGDDWMQPKQRHRRHHNKGPAIQSQSSVSQSSVTSNDTPQELHFHSPSVSDNSQVNDKPMRRPTKLSAAMVGMSSLSLSSNSGSTGAIPKATRGRGRGIAANFTNKMT